MMTDAILIFTFGPVQSFISEARRAGDLCAGSHILVELARAAGQAIGPERLIYPDADTLRQDVPNKLVAKVPWADVKSVADAAQKRLTEKWDELASAAEQSFAVHGLAPDNTWRQIWQRQKDHYWECYWAAAKLENEQAYKSAYDKCNRAVDAIKRTRTFDPCQEDGQKDTLSGQRSALRVSDVDAKEYWTAVSRSGVPAAKLRPDGRERLDTLGTIKRFGIMADRFPSVSSIAARPFLNCAKKAPGKLDEYRKALKNLLGNSPCGVGSEDHDWPYDGDLFFKETLTKDVLKDSYGVQALDDAKLQVAVEKLKALCKAVGTEPCAYYAIVLLDGDNMGQLVANCQTEDEHRKFSRSLSAFAAGVRDIVDAHRGTSIYEGGDDVLALVPRVRALPLAQALADAFARETHGTASAGVVFVHHRYPLDAALRAVRMAEREAKAVDHKAAIAIEAIKRSGEKVYVHSRWEDKGRTFDDLVELFQDKAISSRFAYELADSAYALEPGDMFRAELKRLITRHRDSRNARAPNPQLLSEQLNAWAARLPATQKEGAAALANWVLLARFVAQGGGQ